MALISLLFMFLTIVYFVKLSLKSMKLLSKYRDVPGPRPRLPVIGNALWALDSNIIRLNLSEYLLVKADQIVKQYENEGYAAFIFVEKVYLVVFKPILVEELFGKVHNKMSQMRALNQWFGDGLILSNYNEWKVKRKQLNPLFKTRILNGYIAIVNDSIAMFIENIRKNSNETFFNITPFVYEWNLSSTLSTLMGLPSNIGSSGRKYVENIEMVQKQFLENMLLQFPFCHFLNDKMKTRKYLKQTFYDLREFGSKVIESRRNEVQKSTNESFLDILLRIQKENANLTDEDIRSEVNSFTAAAFETTGTTLLWLILILGNHAEIQENLRNELFVVFGDEKEREIRPEDLSKLVYTECVIKEVMRLFPAGHTIFREAENEFHFQGHQYAKGTVVFNLVFKSHRDEQTFQNANEFIPERFLDTKLNSSLFAFSGGSRDCIGKRFAMNSMKMFVTKLFLNFQVTSKYKMNEVKRNYLGVLRPLNGVWVKLKKM